MTRSVEIPEAALKAAVDALYEIHYPDDPTMRQSQWSAAARVLVADRQARLLPEARASIEAALPYLASAKICSCRTVAPSGWDRVVDATDPGCVIHGQPAPAGDGGLREALEASARDKIAEWYGSEWNASEDKFYETYDGGGISCVDEEAMLELRGVRLALDLALAAHPAAPAVPQPVDREALSAAVYEKSAAVVLEGGYITTLIAPEDAVAAVLAVLAGEQEQADG